MATAMAPGFNLKLGTRIVGASALVPSQLAVSGARGVDLRLDSFDLSSATRVTLEEEAGSWGAEAKPLDECILFGDTFWHHLDLDTGLLQQDDHALLKDVFNPALSDRRIEGNFFAPPDARHSYVTKLRVLVKEEQAVRQKREEHFASTAFLFATVE